MHASVEERFWCFVDKSSLGGCWTWTGWKDKNGYGGFWFKGKTERSHRISFFLTHGRMPHPLGLHSCDNPPCVRPDHLFLGTLADNTQDMINKRRNNPPYGERSGNSKLTKEQICEIRVSRLPGRDLEKIFSISRVHINRIKAGTRWAHVQQGLD